MADLKAPFDRKVIEAALDEVHNRIESALQRRKEILAEELADRIAATDLAGLSDLLQHAPFAWVKTINLENNPSQVLTTDQMEIGLGYNRIRLDECYSGRAGRPVMPGHYRAIVVMLPIKGPVLVKR
jgi:hypothetical protein